MKNDLAFIPYWGIKVLKYNFLLLSSTSIENNDVLTI
jgi:hypothetical protein